MMKPKLITLLALLAAAIPALSSAESVSNRVSYVYYSNLWAHADLVIIGRATAARDTGERVEMKDPHHVVSCEKWETTFDVRLVLKGSPPGEHVTLVHFRRPKNSKPFCWLGPKLAQFELPPERAQGDFLAIGPVRPEYMLFLTKGKNGHWAPVSGQRNSDFSVREVYGLLNKPKREKTQPEN
jgi:hypothetical protein